MTKIKCLLLWICLFVISIVSQAQTVKSYAAVSVVGTTGAMAVPPLAITIEYHDGYFLLNGIEKFVYRTKNYDGSMQFYPAVIGNSGLRSTGILVSKDYSHVRQFTESIIMGMRMELVYDFSYIGDGYEAANSYMEISNGNYTGGHSHGRDWADCSSCNGSGRCKYCGGSGRYEYARDGRCGVCRGTGRCVACEGKGGYYY